MVTPAVSIWSQLINKFHNLYYLYPLFYQNSLLVKRQNDNILPGIGRGKLVPSSHKGSGFRYAVVRQFSNGDERIREDIPVPASFSYGRLYLQRESDRLLCVDFCNACFWDKVTFRKYWLYLSDLCTLI